MWLVPGKRTTRAIVAKTTTNKRYCSRSVYTRIRTRVCVYTTGARVRRSAADWVIAVSAACGRVKIHSGLVGPRSRLYRLYRLYVRTRIYTTTIIRSPYTSRPSNDITYGTRGWSSVYNSFVSLCKRVPRTVGTNVQF